MGAASDALAFLDVSNFDSEVTALPAVDSPVEDLPASAPHPNLARRASTGSGNGSGRGSHTEHHRAFGAMAGLSQLSNFTYCASDVSSQCSSLSPHSPYPSPGLHAAGPLTRSHTYSSALGVPSPLTHGLSPHLGPVSPALPPLSLRPIHPTSNVSEPSLYRSTDSPPVISLGAGMGVAPLALGPRASSTISHGAPPGQISLTGNDMAVLPLHRSTSDPARRSHLHHHHHHHHRHHHHHYHINRSQRSLHSQTHFPLPQQQLDTMNPPMGVLQSVRHNGDRGASSHVAGGDHVLDTSVAASAVVGGNTSAPVESSSGVAQEPKQKDQPLTEVKLSRSARRRRARRRRQEQAQAGVGGGPAEQSQDNKLAAAPQSGRNRNRRRRRRRKQRD